MEDVAAESVGDLSWLNDRIWSWTDMPRRVHAIELESEEKKKSSGSGRYALDFPESKKIWKRDLKECLYTVGPKQKNGLH